MTGARATGDIRVSVCMPAFNEEAVIAETVAEAAEVLAGVPERHEILVVDDGSTDRTGAILAELAESEPMLRVLVHERNLGHAAAQRTLVGAAEGDVIFHIGADREWRMAELVAMLDKLEEGYDIVIGVRRNKQYSVARKLVSSSYNLLVALLWGKHFGDLGSIKMARASLWKRIPFLADSAFTHAQRILIAHANGARIATVPVDHTARKTGQSKFANPGAVVRATAELVRFRLSGESTRSIGEWRR